MTEPQQREWDAWRRRQERMRYELLLMLFRAAGQETDLPVSAFGFAAHLGVWDEELWNALVWLERAGMVRIHSPEPVAAITLAGVHYIEHHAKRRRTVRGISPPAIREVEPPVEPSP